MTLIPFILIVLFLIRGVVCQYYFKKEIQEYRKKNKHLYIKKLNLS